VQPTRPNQGLKYDEAFEIASDGSSGGEDVDDWLSESKVPRQAASIPDAVAALASALR
jgi:hypothetical protein